MLILASQFDLDEQIDRSPNRVQETCEREVKESKPEILRCRRRHEPFDRPVPTLDLPAIAVLREVTTPAIRHEHRVLPVIVVLGALFSPIDERRLVTLVLTSAIQFS